MTPQSAAIPYKVDEQGVVHVLLVTSKTRNRWILPKGKIGDRLLPSRSAEREAFEEAGVLGRIDQTSIATYVQQSGAGDVYGTASVKAFALEVRDELSVWHEMHHRERRWFRLDAALKAVRDPEIRKVLRAFGRWIAR